MTIIHTTTVMDWRQWPPAVDVVVRLPERDNGLKHLSECLLFIDPELHCTCDDWSPDWTI
jgi:hypothetical protein